MLGLIGRAMVNRSPDILTRLFKRLVRRLRPHREYCVSARSPHYVKDRENWKGCSIGSREFCWG